MVKRTAGLLVCLVALGMIAVVMTVTDPAGIRAGQRQGAGGGSADAVGDEVQVVRVKLGDLPADWAGQVDTCAIDREPDGQYAVLFLHDSQVTRLQEQGVELDLRGPLTAELARFAPLKTLQNKAVPSLHALREQLNVAAPPQRVAQAFDPCDGIGLSLQPYDEYHSWDEGVCFIENLAQAYPDMTALVSIGQSIEGRDLWALKITDHPDVQEDDEQRILITGVTHAREWATHEMMLYVAEYLTSRYESDRVVEHIVNHSEIWLVPVVNPDGFEYSWTDNRMWRKNRRANEGSECDGVDINRNYDYNWGHDNSGSSGAPCDPTYRGAAPASEPETQAIQQLLADQQFAISVSLHTYGQLVLYSWGYTRAVTPESYTSLRALGKTYAKLARGVHGQAYSPGQSSTITYLTNGDASDYAYGAHGALALLPELRPATSGQGGFELPEDEILPNNEENMAAVLRLMLNVASALEVESELSPTLIESPTLDATHLFSLPYTPINQKPSVALGFDAAYRERLTTWLDDTEHQPPYEGSWQVDFEGCGAGSGYTLSIDDLGLLDWANALTSYKVLPSVFEDGAEVMLSNVDAGVNIVGIPSAEALPMSALSVIQRRLVHIEGRWTERIMEERTALQDLNSVEPWIDWTWTYVDPAGDQHHAHPTGAGGAATELWPHLAYQVYVNVPSWDFGNVWDPVYLLRFPPSTVFDDCNHNGVPDEEDIASEFSRDCDGNGIPDECAEPVELKLVVADGQEDAGFGYAVALESATAVVGAPGDDERGSSSGSVYLFELDEAQQWVETAKLLANDGTSDDRFGTAVSLRGAVAAVGAPGHDERGNAAGAAYVFQRDSNGVWTEQATLFADDAEAGDSFGSALAADHDHIVVGAQHDDDALGSAYVFRRETSGEWVQEAKLVAFDRSGDIDYFGGSVASDAGCIVVGARRNPPAGAAYVFSRDGAGTWRHEVKLLPDDGQRFDAFGMSVDVHGPIILVGAQGAGHSGEAYLFRRERWGQWVVEEKLLPAGEAAPMKFGAAVSIDGLTAVVGAYKAIANHTVVGAAYVFRKKAAAMWQQLHKLTPADDFPGQYFGYAVDLDRARVLSGMYQGHGAQQQSGSAYVYTVTADCNHNGVYDCLDIDQGTSEDRNSNGVPDECECVADLDGNGAADFADLLIVLANWGPCSAVCTSDFDGDGVVGVSDILHVLSAWGPCP